MYLSHLSLQNFRNYTQLNLSLERGLFLFYGENAQGKTNLLEAVSMLATASSFHASSDREVVNWGAFDHVAHLKGDLMRREGAIAIEIAVFDPTPPSIDQADTMPLPALELPPGMARKRLKVNTIARKTMDVIGQMKVVLFAPADLHLVDGSPDERRRFLDRTLCQVQPRYCQALVKYRKIVTQRSALLKRIRDFHEDPRMLDFLDDQLTILAALIVHERQRMIAALNQQAGAFQSMISGGREQLHIVYRPSFKIDELVATPNDIRKDAPRDVHNENHKSIVHSSSHDELKRYQEHFKKQLHELRKKEMHQGVCLLGPHRDDLEFMVNNINMLNYGSRGQQRTAALSTKLAELDYMRACTGDEPVLLLDDVFSELDHHRREYLLRQVFQHEQVLLTAMDVEGIPPEIREQAHIFHVVNGSLTARPPSAAVQD